MYLPRVLCIGSLMLGASAPAIGTSCMAAEYAPGAPYMAMGDFDGDGRQDRVRLELRRGGIPLVFFFGDGKEKHIVTNWKSESLPSISLKAAPSDSVFTDIDGKSFRLLRDGVIFSEAECCAAVFFVQKGEVVVRYISD